MDAGRDLNPLICAAGLAVLDEIAKPES